MMSRRRKREREKKKRESEKIAMRCLEDWAPMRYRDEGVDGYWSLHSGGKNFGMERWVVNLS